MAEPNQTKLEATVDPNKELTPASGLEGKFLALQDKLLQAQEKNIVLLAQTRELEQVARDVEGLKAELTAQTLLLADKTRENKHLHQELSRVTGVLDAKLQEVEDLKATVSDLQHQLKTRESERDLLAVMLNEVENAKRKAAEGSATKDASSSGSGWLFKHFKGK